MIVAIPKEILPNERRVALIPTTISTLKKNGVEVWVEKGAGAKAQFPDSAYEEAGAKVEESIELLYQNADVVLKVRPPAFHEALNKHEVDLLKPQSVLVSLLDAYFQPETIQKLAEREVTSFALEFLPRITRAQSMDVLSSMSAIAGYRAVVSAAAELPKYFPMLMTAAGTITPAKVFVIGAGVAGLMAIATAKRLGAIVEAYDTRPVVKEQVESVGAKFVELKLDTENAESKGGYAQAQSEEFYQKQQAMMIQYVSSADVVITTAAIPGKKAPRLITDEMVQKMKPGSVIVDLASERGGNVEGTVESEKVIKHGVTLLGYADHPARVAVHSSQLYSKNISTFFVNLLNEGALNLNMEDEIIAHTLVTHKGDIVHAGVKEILRPTENGE